MRPESAGDNPADGAPDKGVDMEAAKRAAGPSGHGHTHMVIDFLALAATSVAAGLVTSIVAGAVVLMLFLG
jgi:hypothetical protein